MNRYACGFDGRCQEDPDGNFETQAECEDECVGQEQKEVEYLVYQYNPLAALNLASRDRDEVMRRLLDNRYLSSEGVVALLEIMNQVPDLSLEELQELGWEIAYLEREDPDEARQIYDRAGLGVVALVAIAALEKLLEPRLPPVIGIWGNDDNFRVILTGDAADMVAVWPYKLRGPHCSITYNGDWGNDRWIKALYLMDVPARIHPSMDGFVGSDEISGCSINAR